MTVAEFIEILKRYPQDLEVVFSCYSEHCLLEQKDIEVRELCLSRPDGWVQNNRPDMESKPYLALPGN
jgi:hypothetical protein